MRFGIWLSTFVAVCLANPAAAEEDELVAGAANYSPSPIRLTAYADVGLSKALNNGRGFVFDTGGMFSSRFPGTAWVLLGDPWSTAVNSRGEPADTEGSFAFTHNPVASNGALTFLINELNLDLSASPWPSVFAFASIDFMPRAGNGRGNLGDFFELDFAYVDWTPFDSVDLTITVGKMDGVFGREYRVRESPDRNGIVPSLLFRYVGGQPLGVKVRGKFLNKRLVVALAALNGSSFIETMNFSDDVDRNDMKTGSGRISFDIPLWGAAHLDVGLSGEAGGQGRSTDILLQWQWGFDAFFEWNRLELKGEFVRGIAQGGGLGDADGLDFRAFYVEAFVRVMPWIGVLGRYEERHAVHTRAKDFAYLIHVRRAVAGIRIDPIANIAIKLEYVGNFEIDPLPQFPNDVFTSSLVVGL